MCAGTDWAWSLQLFPLATMTASQSSQRTGGYKNQVHAHAKIVCGHNSRAVNYKELIIPKPWMLTVTSTLYYSHTLYIIVSLYVYLSRGLHSPNFVYSWVRISWTDAHVHPNSGLISTLTMHYFVSVAVKFTRQASMCTCTCILSPAPHVCST